MDRSKLTSRKFWVSVAAFLAALGTTLSGLAAENEMIAAVGILAAALSAGIYAFSEAYVDAAAVVEETTEEEG